MVINQEVTEKNINRRASIIDRAKIVKEKFKECSKEENGRVTAKVSGKTGERELFKIGEITRAKRGPGMQLAERLADPRIGLQPTTTKTSAAQ